MKYANCVFVEYNDVSCKIITDGDKVYMSRSNEEEYNSLEERFRFKYNIDTIHNYEFKPKTKMIDYFVTDPFTKEEKKYYIGDIICTVQFVFEKTIVCMLYYDSSTKNGLNMLVLENKNELLNDWLTNDQGTLTLGVSNIKIDKHNIEIIDFLPRNKYRSITFTSNDIQNFMEYFTEKYKLNVELNN